MKEPESKKNKVRERQPCRPLPLSEQTLLNGTKCCNQRVEAEKHNPSSCLYYLDSSSSYSPGSSSVFSEQEETTTSLCHVNQEHSLWTVSNKYSNCHCKKINSLRETNKKNAVVCVLSGGGYSCYQVHDGDLRE